MTMLQLTSEINIEIDEVLNGVAKLDTPDLERVLSEVSVLLARRKAPHLSADETMLLENINRGLPASAQQRYDKLTAKLLDESISTAEHEELLGLIEQVEAMDAERLQALIELAQIRHTSIDDLMNQLGIHSRARFHV